MTCREGECGVSTGCEVSADGQCGEEAGQYGGRKGP